MTLKINAVQLAGPDIRKGYVGGIFPVQVEVMNEAVNLPSKFGFVRLLRENQVIAGFPVEKLEGKDITKDNWLSFVHHKMMHAAGSRKIPLGFGVQHLYTFDEWVSTYAHGRYFLRLINRETADKNLLLIMEAEPENTPETVTELNCHIFRKDPDVARVNVGYTHARLALVTSGDTQGLHMIPFKKQITNEVAAELYFGSDPDVLITPDNLAVESLGSVTAGVPLVFKQIGDFFYFHTQDKKIYFTTQRAASALALRELFRMGDTRKAGEVLEGFDPKRKEETIIDAIVNFFESQDA